MSHFLLINLSNWQPEGGWEENRTTNKLSSYSRNIFQIYHGGHPGILFSVSEREAKTGVSKCRCLFDVLNASIHFVSVEKEEKIMQSVESLAAKAVFKSFGTNPSFVRLNLLKNTANWLCVCMFYFQNCQIVIIVLHLQQNSKQKS